MTQSVQQSSHWLDQYGSDCFSWREHKEDARTNFYRPLGLVESCFDIDGRYYEGRADISLRMNCSLQSGLDQEAFRRHITLAWACFRFKHILAQVKAPAWQSWMHKPAQISHPYCFCVTVPESPDEALKEAETNAVFLEQHFDHIDATEFYLHAGNCSRMLSDSLARLFVLPVAKRAGHDELTFLLVVAHEIGDGISTGSWMPGFLNLLNTPDTALQEQLTILIQPETIRSRLPPAQESLYPKISGSLARQRWFWVISRVLRHVRRPLPAGFSNPLLRKGQEAGPPSTSNLFSPVLNYDRRPSLSSAPVLAQTSKSAMLRLTRLCREAKTSIGAGSFALAAILMMEFYESQHPQVALQDRKPFITGFPLNPRPFLVGNPPPESLMLAFSDGIMLPFLSSSLDLDGRLRLLARQAQRQLAAYQKRVKLKADEQGLQYMGSRGAGRLLAIQYLASFERRDDMSLAEHRTGWTPQGKYLMRPNATRQTCGVSSIGKRFPLNTGGSHDNPDFKILGTSMQPSVRPRDGEFLIAIDGGEEGLRASVSVDGSSMDPELVSKWKRRFETILDEDISQAKL